MIDEPGDLPHLASKSRITGGPRADLGVRLKAAYESGKSVEAIAHETGRSYGFVHRLLRECGAQFRGRGGPRDRKRKGEGFPLPSTREAS